MTKEKKEREVPKFKSLGVTFSNFSKTNNERIVNATCRVAYAGKNRNWTDILRSAFDEAQESMGGIPVVGNWLGDNFGGHDLILEEKGNKLTIKENTIAYGYVPEDCNPRWEEVEDDNGNMKLYLTVDVRLWEGKYPEEIAFIRENGINQSMEISIEDYDWSDDDYLVIKSFTYNALCLLGRDEVDIESDVEPCFENAEVSFSVGNDIKKQIQEMKRDFEGGEVVEEVVEVVEETVEEVVEEVVNEEDNFEAEVVEEVAEEVIEEVTEEVVEENVDELKAELLEKDKIIAEQSAELETLREFKANEDSKRELAEKEEVIDKFKLLFNANELAEIVDIKTMCKSEIESALSLAFTNKQLEEVAKLKPTNKEVVYSVNREEKINTKKSEYAI